MPCEGVTVMNVFRPTGPYARMYSLTWRYDILPVVFRQAEHLCVYEGVVGALGERGRVARGGRKKVQAAERK